MATSEFPVEATPNATATRLRATLLWLHAGGAGGALAELLLMGHYDGRLQFVPLGLLGADLLVLGWWILARSRAALRAFQGIMLAFVAGGLAGLWFHYRGNVEFALEVNPDLSGMPLLVEALTGGAPALAPGTMLFLAAIGFAFTVRHPVLAGRS